MEDTFKELNINAKSDKCTRVKKIMIKELEGNFIDKDANILGYARYLEFSNPINKVRNKARVKG